MLLQVGSLVTLFFATLTAAAEDSGEYRLVSYLLTRYNRNVRPAEDPSKPVTLMVHMALNQFIDLDDSRQMLLLKTWMRTEWYDAHLTWDPGNFNNLTNIRILAEKIWLPDLTIHNGVAGQINSYAARKRFNVIISSDGYVKWNYPALVELACPMDFHFYPWDQQICHLTVGMMTYSSKEVALVAANDSIDLAVYVSGVQWRLKKVATEVNAQYYTCCSEDAFNEVTFYFFLNRYPLYQGFFILLPSLLTIGIAVLAFYLPAESGEKVSFGVKVLLAIVLFLLMVAESTPTQSESLPLLSLYFAAAILLLSVLTCMAVVVLQVYHRGTYGRRPQPWVRQLLFTKLSYFLCLHKHIAKRLAGCEAIFEKAHADGDAQYFRSQNGVSKRGRWTPGSRNSIIEDLPGVGRKEGPRDCYGTRQLAPWRVAYAARRHSTQQNIVGLHIQTIASGCATPPTGSNHHRRASDATSLSPQQENISALNSLENQKYEDADQKLVTSEEDISMQAVPPQQKYSEISERYLNSIAADLSIIHRQQLDKAVQKAIIAEWCLASYVLDRFLLFVITVAALLLSIGIFCQPYFLYQDRSS